VTLEFRGSHKIEGVILDQVLSDPYVRSLKIISIRIRGSRYKKENSPSRSVEIRIDSEFLNSGPISISIDGDRDASIAIRDRIEKILKGCWVWYSRAYRPVGIPYQVTRFFVGCAIAFSLVFVALLPIRGLPHSPEEFLKLAAESLLLTPSSYILLAFLRARLFPRLLFNIGKSADAVSSAVYWRNTLFVGLGLAVLAGIIGTLITDRLK